MKPFYAALLLWFVCITSQQVNAQHITYTPSASNLQSRQKFQDMKFGLFIHWGIYSVLGDGEWVMNIKHISYKNYSRLADFFNPQQFNARNWVKMAKDAGMKYITITARHHDGFSMFNTKASAYNIVDATPYQHDPLMDLAKECERQGIELHFYYSLLDWGRKDYAFGRQIANGGPEQGDWPSYINFMKAQLTELITKYPAVKGIWFDGEWERENADWHFDELYALIHRLNPAILVGNNHHHAARAGEDFQIFEKDLPGNNTSGFSAKATIGQLPLETCETMNNSWGFNINDNNYKSVKQVIHYLVNAAGLNANLLLNVGPMPNGKIQTEFTDTLASAGKWLKKNGKSIYATRGNIIPQQTWGTVTAVNNTWFVHVLNKVSEPYLFIPQVKRRVRNVTQLITGTKLKYKQQQEGVFIDVSQLLTDPYDTVIQIDLN